MAAGAQFLQARPGGLVRVADVKVDIYSGCPQAAARPSGAGVVAVHTFAGSPGAGEAIRAAVREPGGEWGLVSDVTGADDLARSRPLAVGVAIAWADNNSSSRDGRLRLAVEGCGRRGRPGCAERPPGDSATGRERRRFRVRLRDAARRALRGS